MERHHLRRKSDLSSSQGSAVLNAHDSGGVSQVRGTGLDIPQSALVNQTISLPKSELVNLQEQDDVLGRGLFCI